MERRLVLSECARPGPTPRWRSCREWAVLLPPPPPRRFVETMCGAQLLPETIECCWDKALSAC